MTERHDRRSRMSRGDALMEPPQIVDAFDPAAGLRKEAGLGGRPCRTPVAATVVAVHGVPLATECLRDPRLAARVLPPAMRDLDHRFERFLGQPAVDEARYTIRRLEWEGRCLHVITSTRHVSTASSQDGTASNE